MSYLVRRLTPAAFVPTGGTGRDSLAEQARLTPDEVAERLESGWLRSNDLVMIAGTWTTLSDSLPFAEIAEPFARREQRRRTLVGGLGLLAFLAIYALLFASFFIHRH